MDASLYSDSIKYEVLTKSIYESISKIQAVENIDIKHNAKIKGQSGVEHQIDVLWRFKQDDIVHTVLIECKNYSSTITLDKVRNFFAVLHDIGNSTGIMVTKVGYQKGSAQFAKYYNIRLKLLRKPTDKDWAGRVKNLHFEIIMKIPASTPEHPINSKVFIRPRSNEQEVRLNNLERTGKLHIPSDPNMRFYDAQGNECTEAMGWWLPRMLKVLDKNNGGPYEQRIELDNKYIYLNRGQIDEEFVQVIGLVVQFYVETIDSTTFVLHGEEIIEAILKDYFTDDVEYIKHLEPK